MAPQSPFGHTVFIDGPDYRAHARRLNPRTTFFMDNTAGALSFKRDHPDCYVIHRTYHPDEDDWHYTPGRTLREVQDRARDVHNSLYINLSTEPDLTQGVPLEEGLKRLVDEQLRALQWAQPRGVRVAALHLAHYGLDERHWPILDPITDYIAAYPDLFLFCCDEYGAGHLFSGVLHPGLPGGNEVGHIQPETWKASPVPYYYHVGRITNYWRYRQANGKPLPRCVITEHGLDALGDVTAWRNSLLRTPPYGDIRGWKSLQNQWRAWYGPRNWSPERAYAEMLMAAWREIYSPWPNMLGVIIYGWGWVDPQWEQFDVRDAKELQTILEGFKIQEAPPVTTVPKPADAGAAVRRIITLDYKVRTGPGLEYGTLGVARSGTGVDTYPATRRAGGKYQWIWVEAGNLRGWMADQGQWQPVFGETATLLPVAFLTQRDTGEANNCGEASLAMVLNWHGANVTVQDVVAVVGNRGAYANFSDLGRAASYYNARYKVATNVTLQDLHANLNARRPVIALVKRGKLPGYAAVDKFDGAHFVVVTGYGDNFVVLHDPLSPPGGAGVNWKVHLDDFMAAWRTTPGNSGMYQAFVVEGIEDDDATQPLPPIEPPTVLPPLPEWLANSPQERARVADLFAWFADYLRAYPGVVVGD